MSALTATQSELSLKDLGALVSRRCAAIDEQRMQTLAGAKKLCDLILDQGRDLLLAKARVPHGGWGEWLVKYFNRDERTAQRYMAAYLKNDKVSYLEDEHQARQMLLLSLELSPTSVEGSEPKIPLDPGTQRINSLCEWITRERECIHTWEPERKRELKDRLKPVVELYATL